jgi:trigger factor
MNFKKLLAILLAAIMCATVFTACTPSNNQENGSESESTSDDSQKDPPTEDKKPVERFDYFNNDVSQFISINVSDYKGTTVTIDKMFEATDEGVMAYIDMLCNEYKVLSSEKITDRPVKKGDVVMLYYEGYKDGVAFQGGSNMNDTKPYQLEIGSGAFIPGFEDALIGIVPSETGRDNLVDLNLTFPKDYHSAELAGKDVVFKVYIEYISEYVPAEYNEDFITKTLKYETKDSDIKASFEKYIKDEILPSIRKTEILNSIWDTLFD